MSARRFPTFAKNPPGVRRVLISYLRISSIAGALYKVAGAPVIFPGIVSLVLLLFFTSFPLVFSTAQDRRVPTLPPCVSKREAEKMLKNSGFNLAAVEGPSKECADGAVFNQSPPGGTMLRAGSTVTVSVARRPPFTGPSPSGPDGQSTAVQQPTRQPTKPPTADQPTIVPAPQTTLTTPIPAPSGKPIATDTPSPDPVVSVDPTEPGPTNTKSVTPAPSAAGNVAVTVSPRSNSNNGNSTVSPTPEITDPKTGIEAWIWWLAALLLPISGVTGARVFRRAMWKRQINTNVSVGEPSPVRFSPITPAAPAVRMNVKVLPGKIRFRRPIKVGTQRGAK